MDTITLKKNGFYLTEWDSDKKKYITKEIDLFFDDCLISFWNHNFKIDKNVTLEHLIYMIKSGCRYRHDKLKLLGKLSGCNLEDYIKNDIEYEKDPDSKSKITHIDIYKYHELDNMSDVNVFEFQTVIGAHGFGAKWNDPSITEDTEGCNTYALEFTEWKYMLRYKLRLQEKSYLSISTYVKLDKPMRTGFFKSSKGKTSSKPSGRTWVVNNKFESYVNKEIKVTFTLGEFFTGLFNEICFFENPVSRLKQSEIISERLEKSKDPVTKDEYFEMKDF